MKITRRDAGAVSGLALAGSGFASGSAVAQMEHEGHGLSSRAPAKPESRDNARTLASWNDIAKGTRHPARTIDPGEVVPPGEPGKDYKPVITPNGTTLPNMVGADAARMKRAIRPLIPDFMAMGTTGMGEMSEMQTSMGHMGNMQMTTGKMSDHSKHMITGGMSDRSKQMNMGETSNHPKQMTMGGMSDHSEQMATPENRIAMKGRDGPYDTIDMGGMFTVVKVRENLTSYADPGWYQPPAGTVAQEASRQDVERDGI